MCSWQRKVSVEGQQKICRFVSPASRVAHDVTKDYDSQKLFEKYVLYELHEMPHILLQTSCRGWLARTLEAKLQC